ncbi:MAG: hypothetical protein PUH11_08045 [Bacilli bacterium]|nr:hypothetical protein [Bacilli bacterium]
MKKILLIILTIIVTIMSPSCKNKDKYEKVDDHYSGLYFEIKEDTDYKLGNASVNPCIYLNHNKNTLVTDSGLYAISFSELAHPVMEEEGETAYLVYATMTFPKTMDGEIKVYLIKEDESGNFFVDKETSLVMDLSKKGTYSKSYKYILNDTKYRFQITINCHKKGE